MENGKPKLTPTQARIVQCLSDGRPHKKEELLALLDDPLSDITVLRVHISEIRKLLPRSQDIVCVARQNTTMYRHMKVLISMDE